MTRFTRLLILSGLFASSSPSVLAEDVLLFIQPLENAPIIGRADAKDPAIVEGSAVLDISAAAKGWKWAEYSLTTEGYVPTSSVSKNFTITPGTFVRNKSNSGAIILTTATASDTFEILSSEPDWTGIRFTKPIPVYFKEGAIQTEAHASAPASSTQKQDAQPATHTHTRTSPDISKFDPNSSVGTTPPTALAPENVQWQPADGTVAPLQPSTTTTPINLIPEEPQRPEPIVVRVEDAAPTEIPQAPNFAIGTPTRTLSGKLVREIRSYGPRYPLRLKAGNGKRVAYIDISNLFINDLRPYLNQKVFVSGEVRPVVPGSKELVIHARVLRLIE